ncbi:tobamovirus multiplication protein 1-like isoform x1 [Anaeramoeba flamelloides]|uniref:Tobamovirus multiplication protein 1-like isoform x1 n=1 Tax=Anaeramoeba flamelloides TaxID=1746091 RepID=A0AAV7Z684_9EUKA|nr:tobamovirus multiplication protein 1-like isoform x1 [Anaeramoeba flamelloides]KAJ6233528.1 tobamovirus multiplication protein 1-like isoform x1 [Anaeramoeba flamelloides]
MITSSKLDISLWVCLGLYVVQIITCLTVLIRGICSQSKDARYKQIFLILVIFVSICRIPYLLFYTDLVKNKKIFNLVSVLLGDTFLFAILVLTFALAQMLAKLQSNTFDQSEKTSKKILFCLVIWLIVLYIISILLVYPKLEVIGLSFFRGITYLISLFFLLFYSTRLKKIFPPYLSAQLYKLLKNIQRVSIYLFIIFIGRAVVVIYLAYIKFLDMQTLQVIFLIFLDFFLSEILSTIIIILIVFRDPEKKTVIDVPTNSLITPILSNGSGEELQSN